MPKCLTQNPPYRRTRRPLNRLMKKSLLFSRWKQKQRNWPISAENAQYPSLVGSWVTFWGSQIGGMHHNSRGERNSKDGQVDTAESTTQRNYFEKAIEVWLWIQHEEEIIYITIDLGQRYAHPVYR